jgi:hypothetical protein
MNGIRWIYYDCAGWQFHQTCKRLFYAAVYSNAAAQKVAKDFYSMYLMGGEL